ncbi:MAG: hypothetical protein K2M79_05005 [Muribaculaceae bacterium]|nr:hypothetical protein [Muribaculaceae bacterium]
MIQAKILLHKAYKSPATLNACFYEDKYKNPEDTGEILYIFPLSDIEIQNRDFYGVAFQT